jgi:hypothetical protein
VCDWLARNNGDIGETAGIQDLPSTSLCERGTVCKVCIASSCAEKALGVGYAGDQSTPRDERSDDCIDHVEKLGFVEVLENVECDDRVKRAYLCG